jgi:hypothetical protein
VRTVLGLDVVVRLDWCGQDERLRRRISPRDAEKRRRVCRKERLRRGRMSSRGCGGGSSNVPMLRPTRTATVAALTIRIHPSTALWPASTPRPGVSSAWTRRAPQVPRSVSTRGHITAPTNPGGRFSTGLDCTRG